MKYLAHDPGKPVEAAAREFCEVISTRRSVREFSSKPVDRAVISWIIRAAGSAPSGANKQPWRFVAIDDPALKREIRGAAEAEERLFYDRRAGADWLRDLEALGTGPDKPFLEEAPWLIAVFKLMRDERTDRLTDQVYYVNESVGIAAGVLITAVHLAGLACLTHTPSPMKFLSDVLGRPPHERPFLLIPVGYPVDGCTVPKISRKSIGEILTFNREPAPE